MASPAVVDHDDYDDYLVMDIRGKILFIQALCKLRRDLS